jgi:hypothetical protein
MGAVRLCRLLVLLVVSLNAPAVAQTRCDAAIAQFRRVLDSDVQTGHVNKAVYGRILPELSKITETCRAGRDPQAISALTALKRRHGYH